MVKVRPKICGALYEQNEGGDLYDSIIELRQSVACILKQ